MSQNILTHHRKPLTDIPIRVPQHGISELAQIKVPLSVCFGVLGGIVLSPVNLDNKPCACDIEIHDEVTDGFLAVDGYGEAFEKVIPEVFFFGGHVFAENSGEGGVVIVIVILHG
jgi:hypothetical protein